MDELRWHRQKLFELTSEVENTEAVLLRIQQHELRLLVANALPELLNELVNYPIGKGVVTLVLADPMGEIQNILYLFGVNKSEFPAVIFVDNLSELNSHLGSLKKPSLGPFLEDMQPLFHNNIKLRSVALLPLIRGEKNIGCLNLGAQDPIRYTRHHAAHFLEHLARVAAVCLQNVVTSAQSSRGAFLDPMTGLFNRSYLDVSLRQEVLRSKVDHQDICCLLIDLDGFEVLNDSYGYEKGNQVLHSVTDRISQTIGEDGIVGRYGGDEFAIFLPRTSLSGALKYGKCLLSAINSSPVAFTDNGEPISITTSLGLGIYQTRENFTNDAAVEAIVGRADEALYRAKRLGGNRVEVWRPDSNLVCFNEQ